MATWIEDTISALQKLGGVGNYKQIYDEVEKSRKRDLPDSWKAIIRRTIETYSSDSEAFVGGVKKDLFYSVDGIGKGVWGLRNYNSSDIVAEDSANYLPDRVNYNIERVIRDSHMTRYLKNIHDNTCQICGIQLELANHAFYSEAHHIKPLGNKHNGPDIQENIIIVCPNHHALLDYGAIEIDFEKLIMSDVHTIGQQYVDYHNEEIYTNGAKRQK